MKTNQKIKILTHLYNNKTINPHEARELYRCERLASRIADLRKDGHSIISKRRSYKDEFGDLISYAEYSLEAEDGR